MRAEILPKFFLMKLNNKHNSRQTVFIFLFSVIFVLVFSSCSNDSIEFEDQQTGIDKRPTAHLKKITLEQSYSPSQFSDFLNASTYASWLGDDVEQLLGPILNTFITTRGPELWSLFYKETGNVSPVNWKVKRINFDYHTVDVRGDSVVLSAAMFYPDNNLGKKGHVLESVSLVVHTYLEYNTDCPTIKGELSMGRALWNSLVVIPDLQGYGSSRQLGDAEMMATDIVNQIVDCERVALQIAKARGLVMADDYYTDVMGYSLGMSAAMGVAKWMEQCSEEDKKLFRYSKAFVGGGIYGYFEVATTIARGEVDSDFSNEFVVHIPTIPYFASEQDLCGYSPDDFFSKEFSTVRDTVDGHPFSASRFNMYKGSESTYGYYYSESYGVIERSDFDDIYAPDMHSSRMQLDPSQPKTAVFKKMCDRQNPFLDWVPQHRVLIFQAENDNIALCSLARKAYDILQTNGGIINQNVAMLTYNVPEALAEYAHFVGVAIAQARMLMFKDPTVGY